MRFNRAAVLLISAAVLGALSFATKPLVRAAAEERAVISVNATLGEGVLWGVLGGYRSLLADFTWLKSYAAWEMRDMTKCLANMDLATKLDPETTLFWHMGAAVIAYDMPHWAADGKTLSALQKRHVAEKQARLAIEFLDRGLEFLPQSRRLHLDKALIYQKVLNDPQKELEAYAKASEGDAPAFIVRDYARRLEAAGRPEDALKELRKALKNSDPKNGYNKFLEEHMEEIENKLKAQKNLLDLNNK